MNTLITIFGWNIDIVATKQTTIDKYNKISDLVDRLMNSNGVGKAPKAIAEIEKLYSSLSYAEQSTTTATILEMQIRRVKRKYGIPITTSPSHTAAD